MNNIISNQFGILRLLETLYELYGDIKCFFFFKFFKSPQHLFRSILQHCFSVKLKKCFVDHKLTLLSTRVSRLLLTFYFWANLSFNTLCHYDNICFTTNNLPQTKYILVSTVNIQSHFIIRLLLAIYYIFVCNKGKYLWMKITG